MRRITDIDRIVTALLKWQYSFTDVRRSGRAWLDERKKMQGVLKKYGRSFIFSTTGLPVLDQIERDTDHLFASVRHTAFFNMIDDRRGQAERWEFLKGVGGEEAQRKILTEFLNSLPIKPEIEIGRNNFTLHIYLEPITLRHSGLKVTFENLALQISDSQTMLGVYCREGRTHRGASSLLHPHVSSGQICWGPAEVAVRNARTRRDIISLYHSALSVLSTYNHSNPYDYLQSFTDETGAFCPRCKKWRGKEKVFTSCGKCGAYVCEKCMSELEEVEHSCYICDKPSDGSTWRLCKSCKERDALKTTECRDCGKTMCHRHSVSCFECYERVCNRCRKSCPLCRLFSCPEHRAKDPDLAEAGICQLCERRSYNQSDLKQIKDRIAKEKQMKEKEGDTKDE